MADPNSRLPQNVPGKFYVDGECIGCTQCVTIAPETFDFDEESDVAFVKKQPANEDEEGLARQAIEECPVEAIGDNG